jgi:hypothetical protein
MEKGGQYISTLLTSRLCQSLDVGSMQAAKILGTVISISTSQTEFVTGWIACES